MKKRIPLAKPSLGKEELKAIERVLDSGMLTEGKATVEFEKAFAEEGLSYELIKDLLSNEGSGRNDLSSQSEEILRERFRNTRP